MSYLQGIAAATFTKPYFIRVSFNVLLTTDKDNINKGVIPILIEKKQKKRRNALYISKIYLSLPMI